MSYDEERIFEQIAIYKEKIFLLPYQADRILAFDIKTRAFSEMFLPERIYWKMEKMDLQRYIQKNI